MWNENFVHELTNYTAIILLLMAFVQPKKSKEQRRARLSSGQGDVTLNQQQTRFNTLSRIARSRHYLSREETTRTALYNRSVSVPSKAGVYLAVDLRRSVIGLGNQIR